MVPSRPHSPPRFWSGFRKPLLLITCAGALMPSAVGYMQQAQPPSMQRPSTGIGIVRGRVLDSLHHPVSDEVVRLQAENETVTLETVTDAFGTFLFSSLRLSTYLVSAGHAGTRTDAKAILNPENPLQDIDLILEGPAGRPVASSPEHQALGFSDQPTFVIAGVTDWTAVGGHGSDATLRTSEQLARETLSLKEPRTTKVPSPSGDQTEARLRAALAEAPLSYAQNHELGEYYLHAMRYEQAVPLLETASKIGHVDAEDEYDLALACRGIGDLKMARMHVEHALAVKDSANAHRLAGELDEKLGDSLAAVEQYQRAVRVDPSEENYFAWGSELLLHRAIWQAAEVFKLGAKAHPSSARMLTGWATALFASALYDEAASRLCEASDLDPSDPEPYLFLGRIEAAAPAPLPCVDLKLHRFVQAQPGNATANYLYAMALYKRSDKTELEEVKSLLIKAATLDHSCAEAYLQLGILSFAQHEDTKAIDYYTKAIDIDATLSEAHYRLGVAYQRAGDREKATSEFQLHETLEKRQSDLAQQQRLEVKQFQVLQGQPASSTAP